MNMTELKAKLMFQFSVPNKGDCNNTATENWLSSHTSFNSQSPTKGTAIIFPPISTSVMLVSILSPQQRGLQFIYH